MEAIGCFANRPDNAVEDARSKAEEEARFTAAVTFNQDVQQSSRIRKTEASVHDENLLAAGQKFSRDENGVLSNAGNRYGQAHPSTPQMAYFAKHDLSFPDCPGAVGVQIKWVQVMDLDVIGSTFTAKLLISYWWYDGAFDNPVYADQLNAKVNTTSWPDLCLSNCLEMYEGDSDYWLQLNTERKEREADLRRNHSKDPPGMLRISGYVTGKFSQAFFLRGFPFDLQSLQVTIRLPGSGVDNLYDYCRYLVVMEHCCGGTSASESPLNHEEWYIHQPLSKVSGSFGAKQRIEALLPVSRKSKYYINTILVPVGLLTTVSFVSFLLEVDALNDRSGVVLTMLLTTVAYKLVVADKLPKLAYSTILDNYIDGSFVTIFAVCLENVVAFKYAEVESKCAYAICALWICVNIYLLYRIQATHSHAVAIVGPVLQSSQVVSENPSLKEIEMLKL